ncbi:hypothetical protein G9409_07370 [Chlorobium sp. BLA1]|uniref:hypothetical protein n=1 Tax=Candidatus Chlorobium masyuteum TaxID=2716876 RepID=UPI0014248A97|nr:hypothetical protein [Candidatus Chlorobium masyuteum]NHQ60412.1 hypothetical protein [Candidatus Chlorobium masyuteum]NTU44013.1 hypothetical protein [Chlorobiaceae bacterium]
MAEDMIFVSWENRANRDVWRVDYLQKSANGKYELLSGSDDPQFPINVDQFGPVQEDLLLNALKVEFPDTKIRIELIKRKNSG